MPKHKRGLSPEARRQQINERRLARAAAWQWLEPAARHALIHEAIFHLCIYKEAIADVKKYNYGQPQTPIPPATHTDPIDPNEEDCHDPR